MRIIPKRNWYFGSLYCSINQFISFSTVPASVFTMLAITMDRRRAIMSPLSPKITKLVVTSVLLLIWIICTTIGLPPAIYSTTQVPNSQ